MGEKGGGRMVLLRGDESKERNTNLLLNRDSKEEKTSGKENVNKKKCVIRDNHLEQHEERKASPEQATKEILQKAKSREQLERS